MVIVTSFASKLYGMRSHRKKKFTEGFKKLLEEVKRMIRVSRTVIVKSTRLPRKVFHTFIELEYMYRNIVEQLVLYAVKSRVKSFIKLKALKYRKM